MQLATIFSSQSSQDAFNIMIISQKVVGRAQKLGKTPLPVPVGTLRQEAAQL